MNSNIVKEFENIVKFKITDYFAEYLDFMNNDYSNIEQYYSGKSNSVSSSVMNRFNSLVKTSSLVLSKFRTFANKLQKCGFWELNEYCQNLSDTLEKINKLPKYNRLVKTFDGGYSRMTKTKGEIGGMKTIEDLVRETGANGVDEVSLIVKNDLEERNWEIDKLKTIDNFVNNDTDIVVNTVIDYPSGDNVYGKDVLRKITFSGNDLALVQFKDNIKQKCEILLELNKGDVPEFPEFGMTPMPGIEGGSYNYAEFLKEINNNFMQNDIFQYITIESIESKESDINVSVLIKTRYAYSLNSTITL